MRKRRSDSPWGKLTREQTRQMDIWRFEDNLSYAEIVKRALNEFGVTASVQTLTSYFRYRQEELDWSGDGPAMKFKERLAMTDRPGMGKNLDELETRTLFFSAMAAYEMALDDPKKMQVKEVRSLMKMLQEHRRFKEDRKMKAKKLELQEMLTIGRLAKDQQKLQTKEEFEETMMEATDIISRAQQRWTEQSDVRRAERAKAAALNANAAKETKAGTGQRAAEAGTATESEGFIKDIINDMEVPHQA